MRACHVYNESWHGDYGEGESKERRARTMEEHGNLQHRNKGRLSASRLNELLTGWKTPEQAIGG